MSLNEKLKRCCKQNDIPYIKQVIKEWLTQKRQETKSDTIKYMAQSRIGALQQIDELIEELDQ